MGGSEEVVIRELLKDYRERLEFLYQRLKLAPPYHSIEKAVGNLEAKLRALSADDRQQVAQDPARRWGCYRDAFVDSGLNRKHRGIIVELLRSGQGSSFPVEYRELLDTFTAP